MLRSVLTQPIIENSKKIATKLVKVINTLMYSYQAKIGWKRLRKSEKKKKFILSFRPYPSHNIKFQKNRKKIQKIKKYYYGVFSSQNRLGKAENERKQKFSFCFLITWSVIENSQKIAKKLKKLKNTSMASFQAKIVWKIMRQRENKNYHSVSTLPAAKFKIPKK